MKDLKLSSGIDVQKYVNKNEFVNPNHSHPYYEFLFIQHASFHYFVNDKIITPVDYSIVLVNKNTVHKAVYANQNNNTYIIVKFYETMISSSFQRELETLFSAPLLIIPKEEHLVMDLLITRLYKEFQNKPHNYEKMLWHQLNELIVLMSRLAEQNRPFLQSSPLSIIEQAIHYINRNLFTADKSLLSLENVSARFYMNPAAFSRIFKKEAGIGFKDYILSSKICHAKKLLSSTDYPITEVAFRSGFSDSNYFASVFKKYESITPTDYAKFLKKLK